MEPLKREIVIPEDFTQPDYYADLEYISEEFPDLEESSPKSTARILYGISMQSLRFAQASSFLGLPDEQVVRAYRLCLHASSAVMQLHATPRDQTITTTLPTFGFYSKPEIVVEGLGREVPLFMEVWPRMMYLSWLLRDDIGIQTLKQLPEERLKDEDGVPVGAFVPPFRELRYACGIEKPAGEISAIYQQFIDGLDPATFVEGQPDLVRDYALQCHYQASLLTLNAARGADPKAQLTDYDTEFRNDYIAALLHHKDITENKTFDIPNKIDPEFWASLPLMGVASRASDLGIAVDVDSDYAPLRFVEGKVLRAAIK